MLPVVRAVCERVRDCQCYLAQAPCEDHRGRLVVLEFGFASPSCGTASAELKAEGKNQAPKRESVLSHNEDCQRRGNRDVRIDNQNANPASAAQKG